jgi:hypothetical protein
VTEYGNYRFTVTVKEGYSGTLVVQANGAALRASVSGRVYTYTISSITSNQTVTVSGLTSVLSHDREVPADVGGGAVVLPPLAVLSAEFTAGPNPVAKSAGKVDFFRQGKRVDNATLTVYDAAGNVIAKVKVVDNALGAQDRRQVGSWNLKDAKGRLVPEGTYLVRGVVKTADGKKEKVSVVLGVR